jgi:hypothetical protein
MLRRTSLGFGLSVLLFLFGGFAEKTPLSASSSDLIEFPVQLQQKIAAGITPVGTKVQAKLTISTLVHGTVVPKDAVLSGEVTESVAKSSDAPSKLGIRMDSAQWKNGSLPLKAYLTEWYYPARSTMVEDRNSEYSSIHGSVGVTVGGGNPYPPSPTGRDDYPQTDPTSFPPAPDPGTGSADSTHRVRMKDVDSKRNDDGSIALTSKKNSLKLDKYTTYVLAPGTLLPQK